MTHHVTKRSHVISLFNVPRDANLLLARAGWTRGLAQIIFYVRLATEATVRYYQNNFGVSGHVLAGLGSHRQ